MSLERVPRAREIEIRGLIERSMADRPLMAAAISRAYRVREYCYSNLTSRTNEHVSVHVDTACEIARARARIRSLALSGTARRDGQKGLLASSLR